MQLKKFLILSTLLLLIAGGNSVLFATPDFNPALPPEPAKQYRATLVSALASNPSTPVEIGATLTGGGMYKSGANITLRYTVPTNYEFVRWSVDGVEVTSPYTMPARDVTIVAEYNRTAPPEPDPELPPVTISASVSPSTGGTITGGGDYAPYTPITLRANPNTRMGYSVDYWTIDGVRQPGNSNTLNYVATESDADIVVYLQYTPFNPGLPTEPSKQYRLTMVTAMEDAPTTPVDLGATLTGAGAYKPGAAVALRHTDPAGYDFVRWEAEGSEITSPYNMPAHDVTVTAIYSLTPVLPDPEPVTVSVSVSPATGGSITGGGEYLPGDAVRVVVTPNTMKGYSVDYWTIDGVRQATSGNTLNYIATESNVAIEAVLQQAVFNPLLPSEPQKKYQLLVRADPEWAAATMTASSANNVGRNITLSQTPAEDYRLLYWTRSDAPEYRNTNASFGYTTEAKDVTFTAHYESLTPSDEGYHICYDQGILSIEGYHRRVKIYRQATGDETQDTLIYNAKGETVQDTHGWTSGNYYLEYIDPTDGPVRVGFLVP